MKKLFKIQISTIFLLLLTLICGQFQPFFSFLILAFIHEMGHYLACLILKIKVQKMVIMPFGCRLEIQNIENESAIFQMMVYLAGPAMFFFNFLLITCLFQFHWISFHTFLFMKQANKIITFFNLLPIYPLDGYQIFKGFLTFFFPFKKALKIAIFVSMFSFLAFCIYNFYHLQIFMILFLFFEQIKYVREYQFIYQKFLFYKTKRRKYKHYKILKDSLMYKDKNNYLFTQESILDDVDLAYQELIAIALKSKK